MSTNISPSGLAKPQTGDYGNVYFPALEAAIQFLNDHKHEGTAGSGTQLDAKSIKPVYMVPTITWGALDPLTGLYPGVISVAVSGVTLSYGASGGVLPTFFISEEQVILKYIINSASQFTIYSFDNTITPIVRFI